MTVYLVHRVFSSICFKCASAGNFGLPFSVKLNNYVNE